MTDPASSRQLKVQRFFSLVMSAVCDMLRLLLLLQLHELEHLYLRVETTIFSVVVTTTVN